jgi:hypothetical protein
MFHYTYYSYESWGRGYIGRRSCSVSPEQDNYFGTYSDKTFKPEHKIILGIHTTKEEAAEAEVKLHEFFQVHLNPHFANKARQTSKKFYNNLSGEQRLAQSELVRQTNLRPDNPFRLKGESSMSHGRRWVVNSDKTEEIYLKAGEEIPEGWVLGRKKFKPRDEESRRKTSRALKRYHNQQGKTKQD